MAEAVKTGAKAATNEAGKVKALDIAITQIEKNYGQGSIMRLGEEHSKIKIQVIPTGALPLDIALGVGGIPRGRVVEIFGPESSGKTTLALHVVASAQRLGGVAAYIDAEHAIDPAYAHKLGVNLEDLLISQPDSGEDALNIAEILVRSNAVDVIVVDSVAALVPKAEIEGDIGDTKIGMQARLMSQALRRLTSSINKSKTSCIFINQLRMKIGVMFGNPETTPGGRALKFYSSVRLDIRRIASIKDNNDAVVGSRVRVNVVKNKVAAPFRKAEFDVMYNEGISKEGCVIDMGVTFDIIDKKGAWFYYKGERIGQGREQAKTELRTNKKMYEAITKEIIAKHDEEN
ncbi:MAG: recombinase RecA [Candidatus Ancaeobacter aquaticus]|nr:recombinase RecA [Candidatus Ancaeobacter aquaticus]